MDERSDKSFLGTEPLGRLMAHFAVPTIVAQTVGLLHNIVDRVFTGRIAGIGADALTGVGIAPPLIMPIGTFPVFTGANGCPSASVAPDRCGAQLLNRVESG